MLLIKSITCSCLALFLAVSIQCSEKDKQPESINATIKEPISAEKGFSNIKCPSCGFQKKEKLPEEICLLKYTCYSCGTVMTPSVEDCCVFCTYGDVKCPSEQTPGP